MNSWLMVALIGILCLALIGCESRDAAATASGPASAEMKVGGFRQITGTNFLMANAYSNKESGILEKLESSEYGTRSKPVYNLLFASVDDLTGRWLLPHNRFLIWATEELPPAKYKGRSGADNTPVEEERVVRWLYIELLKSDTNNNGKWDNEDRRTIAIVDPSGANYAEIIPEADEVLHHAMRGDDKTTDKFTVVYKANAKLFIADIDLPQRQVTTKDLPAIP